MEKLAMEIGSRATVLAERVAAGAVDAAAELSMLFAERALADPQLRRQIAPLLERVRPAIGPAAAAMEAVPRLVGRVAGMVGQAGARAAIYALSVGLEKR
ncbi:MAG TPA: hypothetical protein VHG28_23145 [Longimicrobiaceae bacterium]|nr:hypothetical protein [Longimicrobiaceae bacterium]